MREREEGDQPDLGVQEAELARLGARRLDDDLAEGLGLRGALALGHGACRRRLGQRLQVRLDRVDLGQRVEDLVLDGGRDLVRVRERITAGELEVEGDLGAPSDLEDDDVVHLAHPRLPHRSRVGALANRLRLLRLHVDDHVRPGNRLLDGPLHGVGSGMALLDRRAVRHADDDVREMAPGGSAHPKPPQLHAGTELLDRRERRLARGGGCAIHEDVDVPLNEPASRGEDEHADEERGDGVSLRIAGARGEEPEEDGERARRGRCRSGGRS